MPGLLIKLYMIPGSGTDWRMYAPQLEQFPDMVIPQWLDPISKKESIKSYAKRLSKTIDTASPFALGGTSLGGMIAQEIALTLKPVAVILISTCSDSKMMPLSKRLLGKLTRATPDIIIKFIFNTMSKMVLKTSSKRKQAYAAMLREIPPKLVRWQSGAATEWQLAAKLSMPVFQIHGAKDTIIPVKNVSPNKIINDGGHLISATHEAQVNNFIYDSLASTMNLKM